MQKIINNNTEQYNFVIKNFEGPLDLLLFLITKNKMNTNFGIFQVNYYRLNNPLFQL